MVKDPGDLVLVGRDREMARILPALERGEQGKPGMVLLMGEAGVGKTRLAREVASTAAARGWRLMSGKCLHESMTPYMPVAEALREGKLELLMEFSRPPRVEQVLFVCPDGRIYAKASRSEGRLDTEIFAGMLMAVGAFVKDSLSGMIDTFSGGEGFNVMGYDRFRIVVGSRPQGNLVVVLTGQETELLKDDMAETLDRLVRNFGGLFCGWDGSPKTMEPLNAELDRFIRSGKYDGIDEVTEPENRHWRLLTNVTRGIARATKEAPLLLFLDDLQWADPSSLGLVRHLLKRLRNERFTVLGTCRSEQLGAEHPLVSMKNELDADGRLLEVDLTALHRDDVIRLVEQEVGEPLGRGELGGLIARDSGGNPFLARELVALLREEEVLVKEGGDWRLTRKMEKIGVPRKVGETILARLGGLSRDEREVLETGAILGEYFRPGPVACVLGISPLQAHRALREIEKRYKLVMSMEEGDRFRFNQALVREVVYKEVPPAMRKEYHRAAVDCLVNEGGSGLAYLAEVAYHAREGRHPDAVMHLRAAGDAARKEFHNAEAVRFFGAALEQARGEPRVELMAALAESEFHAGNLNDGNEWYRKAVEATEDREKRVPLAARQARILERQGKLAEAVAALDANAPSDRTPALAVAKWRAARAMVSFKLWKHEEALEDARMALAGFEACGGTSDEIADCWNTMAVTFSTLTRWADAEVHFRKAIEVAEAGGDKYQAMRALYGMALTEYGRGNLPAALRLNRQTLEVSQRIGTRFGAATALVEIGHCQYCTGEVREAAETLTTAFNYCEEIGARPWTGDSLLWRTYCHLELGELDAAENDAREAVARFQGYPEMFPYAVAASANVKVARGQADEAVALLGGQLEACRQSANSRFLGVILLAMGHALAAQSRRAEAEAHFSDAFRGDVGAMEAWYPAVGLRWWGEALASMGEKDRAVEKLEEARKRFTEMGAALELRKVEDDLAKLRGG